MIHFARCPVGTRRMLVKCTGPLVQYNRYFLVLQHHKAISDVQDDNKGSKAVYTWLWQTSETLHMSSQIASTLAAHRNEAHSPRNTYLVYRRQHELYMQHVSQVHVD